MSSDKGSCFAIDAALHQEPLELNLSELRIHYFRMNQNQSDEVPDESVHELPHWKWTNGRQDYLYPGRNLATGIDVVSEANIEVAPEDYQHVLMDDVSASTVVHAVTRIDVKVVTSPVD